MISLEAVVFDAEDDRAVHLDEPAIAVPCEAGVAAGLFEALDGVVVKAEVEHGVHHAGHGDAGAGADRDEERLVRVAEFETDRVLDGLQGSGNLLFQVLRVMFVVVIKGGADLDGDGEAWRHGQADAGHFREVGALAAEEVAHVGAAVIG